MWQADNSDDMKAAAAALRRGELVAFPTETVYGLGGNGLSPSACRAIYAAKGRPADNPLILHISDRAMLERIAEAPGQNAAALAEAFWPGPLTLVLTKKDIVPAAATGGLDTVAVRLPDHPVARALIRLADLPLAAPSANRSGRPSPTTAAHVAADLGDRIAGIIDGGKTMIGIESTIMDCSSAVPMMLRPGGISREAIEAVIGPVALAAGKDDDTPRAPGMKYRHYAPTAPVYLLSRQRAVSDLRRILAGDSVPVGLLLSEEQLAALAPLPPHATGYSLGSGGDPTVAAERLFAGLRALDEAAVSKIYITDYPAEGIGLGLMNRIHKCCQKEGRHP